MPWLLAVVAFAFAVWAVAAERPILALPGVVGVVLALLDGVARMGERRRNSDR
jgi:hypothetical protein